MVGWLYTGWFVCVVACGLRFWMFVLPVFVSWLIVLQLSFFDLYDFV